MHGLYGEAPPERVAFGAFAVSDNTTCCTYGAKDPPVAGRSRKKVFSFRVKEDELFSFTNSCTCC